MATHSLPEFPLVFTLMTVAFLVIFAVAAVNVISGFQRTARMSNKLFEVVEQELDRRLSEPQGRGAASPGKVTCPHCGSVVSPSEKCPNCGASLT